MHVYNVALYVYMYLDVSENLKQMIRGELVAKIDFIIPSSADTATMKNPIGVIQLTTYKYAYK